MHIRAVKTNLKPFVLLHRKAVPRYAVLKKHVSRLLTSAWSIKGSLGTSP